MWCSGARPAETLSRMGAGAQTYREKLQELLQPGEDKRKGDHLGECNSHMVGWSTDKASLPLEVHEIRVRGNWNSPQNGQFTPCKEVVCKKIIMIVKKEEARDNLFVLEEYQRAMLCSLVVFFTSVEDVSVLCRNPTEVVSPFTSDFRCASCN